MDVENKDIKDSDFTDEVELPKPEKVETEPKVDEKKPVLENPNIEEETEKEEPAVKLEDPDLVEVDKARENFFKSYKKTEKIKSLLTIACLTVMLVGWIVPASIKSLAESQLSLIISLIASAVSIIAIAIFSNIFKKQADGGLKDYFAKYYDLTYKYAFKDIAIKSFEGDLKAKITDQEFIDCGLYKDLYKVGSRYACTFTYKSMDCSLVDCAGQVKGAKALQTVFVGKYLRTPNVYQGSGLYIYFKGNKRALPPNNLDAYNKIEENAKYAIFGEKKEEKFITKPLRNAFAKIKTNKTLVDVGISIKKGKTYFCLGYEDNMMIIPLEHALDVRPYNELNRNLKDFLSIAELLNKKPTKEEN